MSLINKKKKEEEWWRYGQGDGENGGAMVKVMVRMVGAYKTKKKTNSTLGPYHMHIFYGINVFTKIAL